MADPAHTDEIEIWKPVVGWEMLYHVSSLGRVLATDKWVNSKNGSFALKRAKILKQHCSKRTGYMGVALCKDGKHKTTNVHRIVCLAFHPDGYAPGLQVAHNDGSRDNNRADNLRWDTAHGNSLDRVKHGTQQMGEAQHLAKVTTADVEAMRADYAGKYGDLTRLAKRYEISSTQVLNIVKHKHWKHV